jgi:hypothetical protein
MVSAALDPGLVSRGRSTIDSIVDLFDDSLLEVLACFDAPDGVGHEGGDVRIILGLPPTC